MVVVVVAVGAAAAAALVLVMIASTIQHVSCQWSCRDLQSDGVIFSIVIRAGKCKTVLERLTLWCTLKFQRYFSHHIMGTNVSRLVLW
jgi:hypothetical protein